MFVGFNGAASCHICNEKAVVLKENNLSCITLLNMQRNTSQLWSVYSLNVGFVYHKNVAPYAFDMDWQQH